MAIDVQPISTNRYAPEGAQSVNLYSTDFAEGLTLAQLMSAVCLRAGAILEADSVSRMNVMNARVQMIDELSLVINAIANQSGDFYTNWGTTKDMLTSTYELEGLPTNLSSYDQRMMALKIIRAKLDALTQFAQEDMIDLQTLVNRRDVALTTSTNLVQALFKSQVNMASRF